MLSQLRTRLEPLTLTREGTSTPALLERVDVTALAVGVMSLAWSAAFGWLSLNRYLAGGAHAEDLGFTDQVIWNFLRGQWFRMSLYQGATWNTELDLSQLARPDSLLAFHVEPMLLLFVPLYALGAGMPLLLIVQAVSVGLGAIPAFRLAGGSLVGVAVACAYLLSPLGQWAVLADFHTVTLAAPLLLLSVERFHHGRPGQGFAAAILALSAREDVAPVVALLGIALRRNDRRYALALVAAGLIWGLACAVILQHYSGGTSAFVARYPSISLQPLAKDYLVLLVTSGGWLGVLAPLAWLPTLPTLLLNVLASSPWMASGKAHYSVLVLPFLIVGCAIGLRRFHARRRLAACIVLVLGSCLAYAQAGAGPLGGNYSPAFPSTHAAKAASLAATIPADASVSASTTLVPRLTHRPSVYLFPAVLDADYVFVDLRATSAPTSPGDVFLRIQNLVQFGGWRMLSDASSDGLVLLERDPAAAPATTDDLGQAWFSSPAPPLQDGAIDVDGPRGSLRTTWRLDQPVPPGARLEFWLDLTSGERLHVWDIASEWWFPPEHWPIGREVIVDIPDVPLTKVAGWRAEWTTP